MMLKEYKADTTCAAYIRPWCVGHLNGEDAWHVCRTELLQRVQAIQRVVQEEPIYNVKPRSNHKLREAAATTVLRDPNLEAAALILQELENEHEFL